MIKRDKNQQNDKKNYHQLEAIQANIDMKTTRQLCRPRRWQLFQTQVSEPTTMMTDRLPKLNTKLENDGKLKKMF